MKTDYESARQKYKPEVIKFLLIAEAPPDAIERFFYYEDVKRHDDLFLGVMHVLYHDLKESYIHLCRPANLKEKILRRFQKDGFFLLDLLDVPIGCHSGQLSDGVPGLIDRMSKVVDKKTPIILIKVTVYDAAAHALIGAGYENVVRIRMPFPGSGRQKEFYPEFRRALIEAGWKLKL